MKFLLGSDPELMLVSEGRLKSSIPVFTAGKAEGMSVAAGKGAVLHDNVLTEFNTEPAQNEKEFINTIQLVLKDIATLAGAAKCQLTVQASAEFPEEELKDKEALVFGCEPDYCSWDLRVNSPPRAAVSTFRSAGGHLHFGYGADTHFEELILSPFGKIAMVRAADILCGIPSIFLDKDPSSARRRSLYGKAGSHRPKDYGVEYRAMSAWWLASPAHTSLIYQLADVAVDLVNQEDIEELADQQGTGKVLNKLLKKIATLGKKADGSEVVRHIINQSDVQMARTVYQKVIKPLLPAATQTLLKEIDETPLPNFYKAWQLGT
jgi:hypothetical protein